MPSREYTLFFAWTPPNTPWDISLARFDENVFDFVLEHEEGQIPAATIEVKNPRIGLINPSREYWAWISFSWDSCGPFPLMFGRLLGLPTEILLNTIKMKFTTRPTDYVYQKQQIADSLKTLPNYDPLFFTVDKRGDPDSILEGWSALYHVDRVNGRVSASDILVGEDGTVNFSTKDVFYDSFKQTLLQPPLTAIDVRMEVQWQQQFRGHFLVGQWAYPTLGSDPFVGDWPKSGTSFGSGWYAGVSWAGERDPNMYGPFFGVSQPPFNFQWVNTEKHHETGDTMSVSINYTPQFGNSVQIKETRQIGLQDQFATDSDGNPDPINIPAKVSIDWYCWFPFAFNALEGKQSLAMLSMVYIADRSRFEKLEMLVKADLQPVLLDPLVAEVSDKIVLKSGDLSSPQATMLNWSSVGMGAHVNVGIIIFPDNPQVPGQTSSQVCVVAGNTGMTVPTFSNIVGQTTTDGTVVWASMGDTPPSDGAQDWVRLARVPLGTLLLPKPVSGVPDIDSMKIPGALNYPPTGTAVAVYSMFTAGFGGPGALMYECTASGMLGGFGPQAVFRNFYNPSGSYLYIAVTAGTTGEFHTSFNETLGGHTVDGGVVWQNIGRADLAIGGTPGMTPAYSYFPQDRGRLSLVHGICRARAKLRKRARAQELQFDTPFEVAAQLSCRMNGIVIEPRLPGGTASGKIIGYKLEAHGATGEFIGRVTMGCSIGKKPVGGVGGSFTDPGVPLYVGVAGTPNGYVQRGYQKYASSVSGSVSPPTQGIDFGVIPIPPNWPAVPPTLPPPGCPPLDSYWSPGPTGHNGEEIGYTPPVSVPNDDGIVFPLSLYGSEVLRNQWHGVASSDDPNNIILLNLEVQQAIHDALAQNTPEKNYQTPGQSGLTITYPDGFTIQNMIEQAIIKQVIAGDHLWFELVLKPLNTGPYTNAYVIDSAPLQVEKTIDLSAPSTG